MSVLQLQNPHKTYAWGSHSFIQSLLGIKYPTAEPWAELWLGAHPSEASMLLSPQGLIYLDDYVQGDAKSVLGKAQHLAAGILPFLMKVLAADQPLSIQAHPSLKQAATGFARENERKIPLSSALRNYRDTNHKPELLCALTPFQAMCGFRPYQEIIYNFQSCGLDRFFSSWQQFQGQPDANTWRALFAELLTQAPEQKAELIDYFTLTLYQNHGLPDTVRQTCLHLAEYYPQDTGILAPLYLNVYHLQPGEALFLSAGILHAYIRGAGIEIMANSDNVIRGGLTPKHIDTEELVSILDFSPYSDLVLTPQAQHPYIQTYATPAREFVLKCIELPDSERLTPDDANLPQILLCDQGTVNLTWDEGTLFLGKGDSVFVTAATGNLVLKGQGRVWLATVPLP